MNTQSQSTKLKERLQQWQSYADQSVSVPIEGDPDPGNRGVHDAPPGVFQALSPPQASPLGTRGPETVVASRYEEHIAELQAELEHEREQAQTLATKLGQEVMGRQAARQGKTPPRATNPLLVHEAGPHLRKALPNVRKHLSLFVVCLSVLIAGLCSLLALLLDQWMGR